MVFRPQQEAKSYIVANLPADGLGGCKWACVEFSASELLGFLRDYPDVEGVLFNPDSDEADFVPAVLIGASDKALDKPEGDAT
jgi:hypothetical protein